LMRSLDEHASKVAGRRGEREEHDPQRWEVQ
jgi:hypothetical protein